VLIWGGKRALELWLRDVLREANRMEQLGDGIKNKGDNSRCRPCERKGKQSRIRENDLTTRGPPVRKRVTHRKAIGKGKKKNTKVESQVPYSVVCKTKSGQMGGASLRGR